MGTLKLALRTLRQSPVVTGIAIASLALGIGANAAIYSLFDQMLLQALPVQAPEQLVNLSAPGPKAGSTSCNDAGSCEDVFSYPMFRDLQKSPGAFQGLAAHRLFGANLAHGGETISTRGVLVSGSYFPLLGVRPALGRLLGPADDQRIGDSFVTVLSYGFWNDRLGADPAVLNDTIVINGRRFTIVGVAQRGFTGTTRGARPDVFVPITMRGVVSPTWEGFDNRRSYWVYVFGRLAPEATIERADAEINTVYRAILNDVEAPLQSGMSDATLERFRARRIVLEKGYRGQSSLHREAQTPLSLLFAITGMVLLIACANIANLLLARGAARSTEMAIRGSLGASRTQLLRQLLTESCVLALLGGAASLVVARWTLGLIGSALPADVTSTLSWNLSPEIVGFTAVLAILTGLAFGLYPALHATRPDLAPVLRADAGQPSGSGAAHRFRSILVIGQFALSMALLVAAGLFIKSLINVTRVDLGLRADHVVTFGISPVLNGYEPSRSRALFESAERQLQALPGVSAVTASMVPVLAGSSWGTGVRVEGFELDPDFDNTARFNEIGPRYFSTLGIPLLAGREFGEDDTEGTPKVAIVNEAFTRKFNLGGPLAVGKRISTGGDELDIEIVGVVQDARYSDVKDPPPAQLFFPYRQDEDLGFITFYLRTATEPDAVLRAIPSVIGKLDPNLPVEELKTLRTQVRDNVFLDRVISILSAAFAVLATLLAAVGLYGVLAYTVAQRTREIGLRMALGASRGNVRTMVLAQVARMTVLGGGIGILGALALGRSAQSLLFGVRGQDPVVLALVALVLAVVSLAAAYVPARRASQVEPMRALRYE